jgi:hypothetical protein
MRKIAQIGVTTFNVADAAITTMKVVKGNEITGVVGFDVIFDTGIRRLSFYKLTPERNVQPGTFAESTDHHTGIEGTPLCLQVKPVVFEFNLLYFGIHHKGYTQQFRFFVKEIVEGKPAYSKSPHIQGHRGIAPTH